MDKSHTKKAYPKECAVELKLYGSDVYVWLGDAGKI